MATQPRKSKVKSKSNNTSIPVSNDHIVITGDAFNEMLDTSTSNSEIEFSFMKKVARISNEKFETLLRFFSVSQYPVVTQDTLNVSFNYNYDWLSSYRITIKDLDHINSLLQKNSHRENHVIFLMLLKYMKSGDENITIMDKQKTKENIVDLTDYGLRLRKSEELPIDDEKIKTIIPTSTDSAHIVYRYIQRASLIIYDTDSFTVRIDLSYTQTSNNIKTLHQKQHVVELEIEVAFKKKPSSTDKKMIPGIVNVTYRNLMKVLQKSNIIMNPSSQADIVKKMHKVLSPEIELNVKDLPAMNAKSSELIHIVDYINQDYCVTDKADGERHFMFISDGRAYLINNMNEVKEIEAPTNIATYDNSIFDGEYIFNDEHGKFMFLIFDCLCFQGTVKTDENLLVNRLECVKTFVSDVYGQQHTFEIYSGKFDFDKMKDYYKKSLAKHMYEFVSKLENDSDNIISMKYFMFPLGIKPWEIFFLTSILFEQYTTEMRVNDYKVQCPYEIDGCMWTPNDQKYVRSMEKQVRKIYKWKPAKNNSLDCYCEFARDPTTNAIIDVFDNSRANMQTINADENFDEDSKTGDAIELEPKDQIYRILYLYVGKIKGMSEYPVLFHEDRDLHYAHVYLQDGEPRDIEGNILQDKTVIEWAYNNDTSVKNGARWIPLRTRHDKTESVNMHKRKYGNSANIAKMVWKSMTDGIEIDDINMLGNPVTHEAHYNKLKSRITTTMTEEMRQENAYYSTVSNIEEPLKKFHNYLKQNMIITYCQPLEYEKKKERLDMLEYGVGRGGDIGKYLHARLKYVVGFDIDHFGIYSGSDGAISRYQTFKKKRGVIGFDMKFLVCDGGAPLTVKDQHNAGTKSTPENDKSIKEIFDNDNPKLYDVVNCQFVAHYFFGTDYSLNSFIGNLVRFTKPSGYVLITTYDDKKVHDELVASNGKSTTYYTHKDGTKMVLYDLIKRYDGDVQNITGQAIDVHLPVFEENKYILEYIVPKELLINKMAENGFELVETDLFWNIFIKNKMFFETAVDTDQSQTRNFYMKVKEYYNDKDHLNQILYPHTKKNRFYVFQKTDDGTFPHENVTSQKPTHVKKSSKKNAKKR